jgi:hypothetical protein
MNRDLLEALEAVAAELYLDAMKRHPGLFTITGVEKVTDEDRAVFPVLTCIDELLIHIHDALNSATWNEFEYPDPADDDGYPDDDIPF